MSEERSFTVSVFYKFIDEKRLMVAKCNKCGNLILPPKPMCTNCLSTNLKWIELDGKGKLLSYTIIYVAPEQFQSMAPYPVGIVEFKKNLRLPGIIRNVTAEELKVGMELKICFEKSIAEQWPNWSRYVFRPV
jgi:uncharacterized OB-fold protein